MSQRTQEDPLIEEPMEGTEASTGLTQEQQELVDLLRNEIAELVELQIEQDLSTLQSSVLTDQLQTQALQCENFSNAAGLVGLEGLSLCCQQIANNIESLVQPDCTIDDALALSLQSWPIAVLTYLQYLGTETAIDAAQALVEMLTDESWPSALSSDSADNILECFKASAVDLDDDRPAREITAEPSAISLAVEDDINADLLEGMLQQLPAQTAEFSQAIASLAESGEMQQMEVAQRAAHTLKGAANVVNIRGIANLMHHSEDILDALEKHGKIPPMILVDALLRVADCLEAMCETLLGFGEPPDDALTVLQLVLDWANYLDKHPVPDQEQAKTLAFGGLTSAEQNPINRAIDPPDDYSPNDFDEQHSSVQATTSQTINSSHHIAVDALQDSIEQIPSSDQGDRTKPVGDDSHSSPVVRVAESLINELLRLSGENIIANNRVSSQVDNVTVSADILQKQHFLLQRLATELEQLVDTHSALANVDNTESNHDGNDPNSQIDPLEMERYNEWHSFTHRLQEASEDAKEMSTQLLRQITHLKAVTIDQAQIIRDNQNLVLQTRMVQAKTVVPRLQRCVRQTNRLTGRQVTLTITGEETYIDSRVLNSLLDPLMHLLRNAIDHGIEEAELREQRNKPQAGAVCISFDREGDAIFIRCRDDGGGIDSNRVYEKALRLGIIDKHWQPSDEALHRLVLAPGFSTREQVSQTSGRGIGLDVVRETVNRLKGYLDIQSTAGEGTCFILSLPVSLLSTHTLTVRVNGALLSLANRGIEQVIHFEEQALRTIGDQTMYQHGDQVYPVHELHDLAQTTSTGTSAKHTTAVLIVTKSDTSQCALLVEEVLDSHDMVVKPLTPLTYTAKGIVGATILGDGSVAPVLDLVDLLHSSTRLYRDITQMNDYKSADIKELQPQHTSALVVDDSLSARRSLAQFVADMGIEVRTAKDGFEAIHMIEEHPPSLLFVDMEMPRMNGLELTAHVRAQQATQNIPIIMVTSRATEKHRAMADAAGVNSYIHKPFSEEEMLQHIETQLAS